MGTRIQFIKDSLFVFSANSFYLGVNAIVGFLVPLRIGVQQYALYSLFILYVAFVGFAHFGLNDGFYISLGGYEYKTLPLLFVRANFVFLSTLQFASAGLVLVIAAILKDSAHFLIFVLVAANMILINISSFFAFLNQITKKFRCFAFNTIASRLVFLALTCLLFFKKSDKYIPYIIAFTIANIVAVFLYLIKDRGVIWGPYPAPSEISRLSLNTMKLGFAIMLGNIFGILVINSGRFIVESRFSSKDFAIFSFSVYLMSVIYLAAQAVSLAVYPRLSRRSALELGYIYKHLKIFSFLGIAASLIFYFPLYYLVHLTLPSFSESLVYARWLFPAIIYKAQYSLIHTNYFKYYKFKYEYMRNGFVAFIITLLLCLSAYIVFRSLTCIAVATVISWAIWILISDAFFRRRININVKKENVFQAISCIVFYGSFIVKPLLLSGLIYMTFIIMIIGYVYRDAVLAFAGRRAFSFF